MKAAKKISGSPSKKDTKPIHSTSVYSAPSVFLKLKYHLNKSQKNKTPSLIMTNTNGTSPRKMVSFFLVRAEVDYKIPLMAGRLNVILLPPISLNLPF